MFKTSGFYDIVCVFMVMKMRGRKLKIQKFGKDLQTMVSPLNT